MKVSELIEKLKEFDPDLTVTFSDSEDGGQVVTDLWVNEDEWVVWDKAKVLHLSGEYLYKEHIDPKYFKPQERPVHKPSPLNDLLAEVYTQQLNSFLLAPHSLAKMKLPKDGVVEFKIINNRDYNAST